MQVLVGGEADQWDAIALVQYSNPRACFEMISNAEYQRARRSPKTRTVCWGWRLGNPFEGQGYVLTNGPYRFCRHPMHIATTAIWFGWALFYGSVDVAIGASVILVMVVIFVPAEERGIEAKLGEEYRQYKARVPRWWQSRRA